MNIYYIVGLIIVILLLLSYGIPLLSSINKEKFNGSKKIVFTAYTADWCPHCVEFNSTIYGNLVKAFNGNSTVKITKIDCTNDQSGKTKTIGGNIINGFPSLMINVYENGKMNEIQYDGNRRLEDIVAFINNL
jgi:thiol:disulfide interchange protein